MMTATDAYDLVTSRLAHVTGYTARGRGEWRCPAHSDGTPSLSVNRGNEGVILKCQAGCDTTAVLSSLDLKLSDLFDAPRTNGAEQPTDTYPYTDENGELLFEVVRFPNKKFRQRRPDGKGGYEWLLGDTRRVLFHLPQVIDAVRSGRPVFVCEGEKDVLAVERAGGAATCNPHGAGKWRADYADVLKGADVIVVRDQDPPGMKHAADVEASLGGKAKRVRVVDPHTGKDAFDHLNAGHTLEDWLAISSEHKLHRVLLGKLIRDGVPEPTMVHRWLYAGGLHTIQSEPGVGKTWFALWLCVELLNDGRSVIYIDEEGGEELAAERLGALGVSDEVIDARFHYYPFPERAWTADDIEALREEIVEAQRSGPLAVGVLDSLPDFLSAADMNEDSAKEVTAFVRRLLTPFRDVDAALMVLDHLPKPGEPKADKDRSKKRSKYSRGSGAKLSKAHVTILLEEEQPFDRYKSGKLLMWATKDRRGFTRLPRINHAPPIALLVQVDDGTLRIEVKTDAGAEGPWQPTRCMDAVLDVLKLNVGMKHNVSHIERKLAQKQITFRHGVVAQAADCLADTDPEVHCEAGARGALNYWWTSKEEQLI